MLKHIRLYEDYSKLSTPGVNNDHSWQEVRDTIQQKLPFIIIDFKNKKDLDKCIDEELFDDDYLVQTYYLKNEEGEVVKHPSVFIFAKGRTDLKDKAMMFHKRFDVKRLVIGEFGKTDPILYIDGESIDIGANIFSSLDVDDMGDYDFYRVKSNLYKFIN
jgi:hypothetical protein